MSPIRSSSTICPPYICGIVSSQESMNRERQLVFHLHSQMFSYLIIIREQQVRSKEQRKRNKKNREASFKGAGEVEASVYCLCKLFQRRVLLPCLCPSTSCISSDPPALCKVCFGRYGQANRMRGNSTVETSYCSQEQEAYLTYRSSLLQTAMHVLLLLLLGLSPSVPSSVISWYGVLVFFVFFKSVYVTSHTSAILATELALGKDQHQQHMQRVCKNHHPPKSCNK